MPPTPTIIDLTDDTDNSVHAFNIPSHPVPMGRPRVLKSGRCYNASAKDLSKVRGILVSEIAKRGLSLPLVKGNSPVSLRIVYRFRRPNAHYTSVNRAHLRQSAPTHKLCAPDLDNLDKLVMDAGNGVLYVDDSQVVCVHSTKTWVNGTDGTDDTGTLLQVQQLH